MGNDAAIKAYREGKLPLPDGTIIAALHYGHIPSAENKQGLWPSPVFIVPESHPDAAPGLDRTSMANLTDATLVSSRHTTHYWETGPADGPLMMLLHGWPGIGLMWRAQGRLLANLALLRIPGHVNNRSGVM